MIMATLNQIKTFLATGRLAIAGVSRNSSDFSRLLFREFLRRGYDVVPVHPGGGEIEGRTCSPRLQEVIPPVDAVLLMTSPTVTDQVARDCAEAGVKRVWMYRASGAGAVSSQAVDYCESHGIDVIAGECPMMFFADTGFVHQLHGFVRKITGRYPRLSASGPCSCQASH
jgi:predicted CoA-binding protein